MNDIIYLTLNNKNNFLEITFVNIIMIYLLRFENF